MYYYFGPKVIITAVHYIHSMLHTAALKVKVGHFYVSACDQYLMHTSKIPNVLYHFNLDRPLQVNAEYIPDQLTHRKRLWVLHHNFKICIYTGYTEVGHSLLFLYYELLLQLC